METTSLSAKTAHVLDIVSAFVAFSDSAPNSARGIRNIRLMVSKNTPPLAAHLSLIAESSTVPSSDSLMAVERLLGRELPFRSAAAFLLFQLDSNHPEALQAEFEIVGASW